MSRDELPLPWNKALLAIIPGLLATAGLVNADFSIWMLMGILLLAVFLISAYLWNIRQLPAWSLMAVGMLASICLTMAIGVIGGLAAILVGGSASELVLLVLLVALVILLWTSLRGQRVSPLVWTLFAVVIVCQLAVRVKYFVLFGVSWSVAGQWLNISLYAVVVALLLPVALGLCLAQRYGLLAALFVIGMLYMGFQLLVDVNHKVSDQMGGALGFIVYQAMIPMLFTVVAPLWFVRARSLRTRMSGVLALVGLAVILDLVVVGLAYGGALPVIIWISFIPYTLSVLLTLVLTYLLYRKMQSA
jgi:hypothetical protein